MHIIWDSHPSHPQYLVHTSKSSNFYSSSWLDLSSRHSFFTETWKDDPELFGRDLWNISQIHFGSSAKPPLANRLSSLEMTCSLAYYGARQLENHARFSKSNFEAGVLLGVSRCFSQETHTAFLDFLFFVSYTTRHHSWWYQPHRLSLARHSRLRSLDWSRQTTWGYPHSLCCFPQLSRLSHRIASSLCRCSSCWCPNFQGTFLSMALTSWNVFDQHSRSLETLEADLNFENQASLGSCLNFRRTPYSNLRVQKDS